MYNDLLVARLDSKLDRKTSTLVINGFWLEDQALAHDPAFEAALACALAHFLDFLKARHLDISMLEPTTLRTTIQDQMQIVSSIENR